MELSNFKRPGTIPPPKSRVFECICDHEPFSSHQLLRLHKLKCIKVLETKNRLLKRKSSFGFQEGAKVSMSTSQTKFRTHIRLWNRLRNDRGVKRSDPLHTEHPIRGAASLSKEISQVEPEKTVENLDVVDSSPLFDNSGSALLNHADAVAKGIDIEAVSVSSQECEPNEFHDTESEEEEDDWEDIEESTVDDLRNKLHQIRIDHNRKWADFRLGDGYDSKGQRKPIKYNDNMPKYYIAQVSLLKILSQHRGNDLKLFDRIMNWVGFFADKYPGIWDSRAQYSCHTRKTIIPFLARFFSTKDLLPKKTVASLSDGSKVDIPVFDFKSVFENMMLDPELICEENLISNNFDPDSWRPRKRYGMLGPNDIIDDLTTGFLYEKGVDLYCNEKPPPGISKILPCPLIFYTDEAHHDKKGGCKTGPVSMCPAFVKLSVRNKNSAWFNLGFIPNYGLGHGKYFRNYDDEWEVEHKRKKGKKTLTQKKKSAMAVKDHQILYDTILKSFREYCHKYGGLRMKWKGQVCLAKPFLLMLIGDTKEYNTACTHRNSNKTRCICKDCLCTREDIASKFPPCCERRTLAHRQQAMKDAEYAKFISQHQEESVWNDLPIADIREGINGMCPLEWLHLNGQGNFQDGPEVLHNLIGPGDTKKSKKEELDLLFRALAEEIKRNSERDVPLIALRFAIMDLTRVTANERVGNYYMLIICLSTKRGASIMKDAMKEHKLDLQRVIDTMTALLAYDAWCRSFGVPKWEIDNADAAVSQLMQDMITHLPREVKEGSHGYEKVKFHGLWLILHYIKKYGSARNTSSETGERLHQVVVGMNGDGTQRRPSSFTVQCGNRDGERTIIDQAFRYVKHMCPPEQFYNCEEEDCTLEWSDSGDSKFFFSGAYNMYASSPSGRTNNVDYEIQWATSERTAAGIQVHTHFLHCLTSWAITQKFTESYNVTGYTELKVTTEASTTIYRANDYFHGGAWYDWALVQDPVHDSITYIGKILGFFKYNTVGFPSYSHIKINNHDAKTVSSKNMKDDTHYAVVIGSKKEFKEDELESRIATPFRLASGDDAYIVPVHCLKKPLMIVKNYGSTTSTGYLHCLPQHKWASLFTNLIRKHMESK